MTTNLDDLLPLFLSEARDRLDNVSALLGRSGHDSAALQQIRRQLHALKGASRMMRLTELSELCHDAEAIVDASGEGGSETLVSAMDQISAKVERLATSLQGTGPQAASATPSDPEKRPAEAVQPSVSADEGLRVSMESLDRLADQAARLRVMARSVERTVEDSFRFAQLAERGVREGRAEQVLATLATMLRQLSVGLERDQREMGVLADRQLESLVHLQVQPLRPFLFGLARHARELARQLGKEIEVVVSAGETQLDRKILRALEEAFLHLVRNAIDHGIEDTNDRIAVGKPSKGSLVLEASGTGSMVRIKVSDDGRGIDTDAVIEQAIKRGDVTGEEIDQWSEEAKNLLVCRPGFTTRERATEVSGRGVGLDAVSDSVRSVGGTLGIETRIGSGMTVSVSVPVSRRGERVMVAEVGECRIGIPSSAIRKVSRLAASDLPMTIGQDTQEDLPGGVESATGALVLADLSQQSSDYILLDCQFAGRESTLVVNSVHGEEEVVMRAVPPVLGFPPVYDALATMGSGRPLPILSLQRLEVEGPPEMDVDATHSQSHTIRVLLADDSPVTREMIRRLLEGGGMDVIPAANGDEAFEKLMSSRFDCLVTDIEMPMVDGLELTRRLRRDETLKNLPVIVVSTRNRSEDRLAGLEAGADAYLAKQSLDAGELIALVKRVGLGV
ncbi:MAG: response regulator [bacterium]|nr:response regulator [bacterium]